MRYYLYLIKCLDACKIGITSNLEERMLYLQSANPFKLDVLCVKSFFGKDSKLLARENEKILHEKFFHRNLHGEWFLLTHDDINTIKNYNCLQKHDGLYRTSLYQLKVRKLKEQGALK